MSHWRLVHAMFLKDVTHVTPVTHVRIFWTTCWERHRERIDLHVRDIDANAAVAVFAYVYENDGVVLFSPAATRADRDT
ncbi:hypothetical protein Pelo_10029 [Pelomyxa schiedti]|nr:hypothetical protein Pelo_10029 [Pelomyxa schiedti]